MKIQKFILFVSILCGLLFIGFSIPLITEQIAPNDYYGIRLDDENPTELEWYRINRIGGWAMVLSSVLMMVGSFLLYIYGRHLRKTKYLLIFFLLFFGSILGATAITTYFL